MNDSDDDLVRRAAAGQRQAFDALVHRTSTLVWSNLLLHTGDRERAEDLTQETFLRAWRSIATLSSGAAFRPWLLRIAENVRLDEHKSRSRKRRSGTLEAGEQDLQSAAPSPDEIASLNDEKQRMLAALRALPDPYQQVLSLRYLGGADYEQMQRELAVSNGSLRGLLHRGLAMLRERLNAAEPPAPAPPLALVREAGEP